MIKLACHQTSVYMTDEVLLTATGTIDTPFFSLSSSCHLFLSFIYQELVLRE